VDSIGVPDEMRMSKNELLEDAEQRLECNRLDMGCVFLNLSGKVSWFVTV